MRMRALFGRMLPSGQSGRPLFMRRTRHAIISTGLPMARPRSRSARP
jgi:hypothetical protein